MADRRGFRTLPCVAWKGFEDIAVVKRGSWVGQTNTVSVFIKVLGLATKCRAFAHEVHRREEDAGARVALAVSPSRMEHK